MQKKWIILSILGIILISTILIISVTKNSEKYIMYDGIMLAMTITDSEGNTSNITEFPSGTNYTVEVDCGDTAIGRWLGEEWKLAVANIKGNVKCNVDFYIRDNSDKLSSVVQSANPTNNNGYRYSGENPNNYVWFNNEYWRILGLIPVCTTASSGTCSSRTNLVKIIRSESLGGFAYDAKSSGYTGAWGSNTLYTLLNNYYYGKQNGTGTAYCYAYDNVAKTKCDYRTIGVSNSGTDYYGKMVEGVYWNIGASTYNATPGTIYGTESAKVTSSKAKIGLMSASDFGYAAVVSGYNVSIYNYSTAAITGTNWLYKYSYEWTNIQYSNGTNRAHLVAGGYIADLSHPSYTAAVRPVLYLNSEVYKISGTGAMSDPYIIGM